MCVAVAGRPHVSDEPRHERLDRRIAFDGVDPFEVQLHGVRAQCLDVAQARIARASIIDPDPDVLAQRRDRGPQLGVVADRLVLR